MSLADFIGRISAILEQVGIDYMVVGSMASTYHGIARTTHDIDIVVMLTPKNLPALLDAFSPERYYVSDVAAKDAVRRYSQFNIIDMETGWKADLIVRKPRPFSIEELQRRQRVTLLGHELPIASAEDTIIAKLEWAREGQSERQLRDIVGILAVNGATLDLDYLERWVAELGLRESWQSALAASRQG